MLEWVKTFGAVGTKWMYFAHEKNVNWGWAGVECYRMKACVFWRDKGWVCALPARGSTHITTCRSCPTSLMGTHALSTLGREHCHHPTGKLLLWQQPALETEWGSRGPSRSPAEKRERPLLWGNSVQDLCTFHRCSPSPGRDHPRGCPTEILAQFPKDVFSRLPVRALMK